jgi:hypothetical protein
MVLALINKRPKNIIQIQLEGTGFVHSSLNTKPGAAFRHPCRSRHSVHPERPVFKGGSLLFLPLIQIGYTALGEEKKRKIP